jgi:hypothetical protein
VKRNREIGVAPTRDGGDPVGRPVQPPEIEPKIRAVAPLDSGKNNRATLAHSCGAQ